MHDAKKLLRHNQQIEKVHFLIYLKYFCIIIVFPLLFILSTSSTSGSSASFSMRSAVWLSRLPRWTGGCQSDPFLKCFYFITPAGEYILTTDRRRCDVNGQTLANWGAGRSRLWCKESSILSYNSNTHSVYSDDRWLSLSCINQCYDQPTH